MLLFIAWLFIDEDMMFCCCCCCCDAVNELWLEDLMARPRLSSITLSGLTNLPSFGAHEKYRTPFTEPSFLPGIDTVL